MMWISTQRVVLAGLTGAWIASVSCTVVSLNSEPDDVVSADAEDAETIPWDVQLEQDVADPEDLVTDVPSDFPDGVSDAEDADGTDAGDPPPDADTTVDADASSDVEAGDTSGEVEDDLGCVPNCQSKECGIDGCGGFCGTCDEPDTECKVGKCQAIVGCTPDCEGKLCGGDGCGGECGDCVFPGQLTDELEAEVVIRRQAGVLGLALGGQQFTEEILATIGTLVAEGLLTSSSYTGIVEGTVLTGVEMVGNVDYKVFPCQYLTNGFDEPPTTCDALVLLAKNDAFQKLSTLTAPSTLPVSIQESPYADKAHIDYTNAYGTGVRRAAELHRWELRSQEICDRYFAPVTKKEKPLPVVEAYWKGIVVGMQYYAQVLNGWIGAYGYDEAEWPDDLGTIDLCNLNENLVAQAGAEAETGYLAYAEEQSLCGATFKPPDTPEVEAGYAEAVAAFYDGAEDGWQSEFTFSAVALWESLGCVPSIPTY